MPMHFPMALEQEQQPDTVSPEDKVNVVFDWSADDHDDGEPVFGSPKSKPKPKPADPARLPAKVLPWRVARPSPSPSPLPMPLDEQEEADAFFTHAAAHPEDLRIAPGNDLARAKSRRLSSDWAARTGLDADELEMAWKLERSREDRDSVDDDDLVDDLGPYKRRSNYQATEGRTMPTSADFERNWRERDPSIEAKRSVSRSIALFPWSSD